jgi:hypothetical protein
MVKAGQLNAYPDHFDPTVVTRFPTFVGSQIDEKIEREQVGLHLNVSKKGQRLQHFHFFCTVDRQSHQRRPIELLPAYI